MKDLLQIAEMDPYTPFLELPVAKPLVLRPYAENDILKMNICKEGNDLDDFQEKVDYVFQHVSTLCFTLDSPEGIVAIGGFEKVWEGHHVAWILMSPLKKKYSFSLSRITRRIINLHWYISGIRRLEVFVEYQFIDGVKWALHEGFRIEGLLERWGYHDKAYYMMAKVRPRT